MAPRPSTLSAECVVYEVAASSLQSLQCHAGLTTPHSCVQTPACGNRVVDMLEECDDGNSVAGDGCNQCVLEYCGDGIRNNNGEECDDGNSDDHDGCTTLCTACGDGVVRAPEECDDGNTAPNDGCSSVCLRERCGDGVVNLGEDCDDGNADNEDACTTKCAAPRCGDGVSGHASHAPAGRVPQPVCVSR